MFQPDREGMPLPELRALQLARLQGAAARMYERVPAHRARFEAAGVTPDDLRTLGDLARFPLTRKSDLRDHYPLGLSAVPRHELRRLHASSGTTGKPTVVAYDENDLGVFAEVVARSIAHHLAGIKQVQRVQHSLHLPHHVQRSPMFRPQVRPFA